MTPAANLRVWAGQLFLWPTRALYVGQAADTAAHSHHAIQLCVSLDTSFRLSGSTRRWLDYEIALIGSNRRHQLDGAGARLALLYIDPESEKGRALTAVAPYRGFSLPASENLSALRERFRACIAPAADSESVTGATDALLKNFVASHDPRPALDPRVARFLNHVRQRPDGRVSAAEAAHSVALSPHRFQHIFRDNMGVPFRRYLLWLRLISAVDKIAAGASLTDAAHAAGFSDSAHLSRTFRRMFGLAPSTVMKRSEFVQAHDR